MTSFTFGIEIELLLGSRSKTHKTWKSIAGELSTRLARSGIPNHVNESYDKSEANYSEWSVVQEVTVPSQPGKQLWGIELVSPILHSEDSSSWTSQVSLLFKTLKHHFTLVSAPEAATHIHIAPAYSPYSVAQLASIAKAVLLYEPALDALLPAERKSSYWCQSNRSNPVLKGLSTTAECFEYLDWCRSADEVVRTMCLYPAKSAYGRAHGYNADFVHGVYKWDFSGLLDAGSTGTIEFRQCPGSRTADEVRTWVELAVSFVAGAIEHSETGLLDPEAKATMDGLWWVLVSGAQGSGIGDLEGVEKLFLAGGKMKKHKKTGKR
jgi:hypothetical protein